VRCACHGYWDRLRIEQVVDSLLSNAIKYGQGQPIDLTVERDGRRAVLTVQDRGIGIQGDQLERIFERFERAVSVSAYGGLGLGLYLTRQIVHAHQGRVTVQSAPGIGAVFRVELPLEDCSEIH
jgi:signal transduction histidine kinase